MPGRQRGAGIQCCAAGGTVVADGPGWHNRSGGPRKPRGSLAERPAGGRVTGRQINLRSWGKMDKRDPPCFRDHRERKALYDPADNPGPCL